MKLTCVCVYADGICACLHLVYAALQYVPSVVQLVDVVDVSKILLLILNKHMAYLTKVSFSSDFHQRAVTLHVHLQPPNSSLILQLFLCSNEIG